MHSLRKLCEQESRYAQGLSKKITIVFLLLHVILSVTPKVTITFFVAVKGAACKIVSSSGPISDCGTQSFTLPLLSLPLNCDNNLDAFSIG